MKKTTITVKEDLKMRLNQLKYKLGYPTIDSVIRKLIEISVKVDNAFRLDEENEKSK